MDAHRPVIELVHLRQENSKTFRLRDGRLRTVVSSRPLHYWDGRGWKDVRYEPVLREGNIFYPHLPHWLLIDTNSVYIEGKKDRYTIRITTDTDGPGRIEYRQQEDRTKTLYTMSSRADIPTYLRCSVRFTGLTVVEDAQNVHISADKETPARLYLITPGGNVALSIEQPLFLDSAGAVMYPGWEYTVTEDSIDISVIIPDIWLNSDDRVYPIILDPTYDSGMINITNQGTYSHTTPNNITITTAKCRWYGKSTFKTVTPSPYETSTWNAAQGTGSASTSFPSVSNPTRCYLSASGYATGMGQNPVTVSIRGFAAGSQVASNSNSVMRGQDVYAQTTLSSSYAGKSAAAQGSCSDGTTPAVTIYVETYYMYQPAPYQVETKTTNCAVSIFGTVTTGPSSVNNQTWSSWYTFNGFRVGLNTMTFSIGGSGQAGFEFYYDYTINKPIPIGYVRVALPNGTVQELVVAAPNDPNLENTYVRVYMPWMAIGVADLVQLDDPERSNVRIMTPAGIRAWRKKSS